MNAAPLRKVVKRDTVLDGTSLSKRGTTVTVVNHYRTHFTLECGHVFIDSFSAPLVERKRCKQCQENA